MSAHAILRRRDDEPVAVRMPIEARDAPPTRRQCGHVPRGEVDAPKLRRPVVLVDDAGIVLVFDSFFVLFGSRLGREKRNGAPVRGPCEAGDSGLPVSERPGFPAAHQEQMDLRRVGALRDKGERVAIR